MYIFPSSSNNFFSGCSLLSLFARSSFPYSFWNSSILLGAVIVNVATSYCASTSDLSCVYFSIRWLITSFSSIRSARLLNALARLLSFLGVYTILNLYYSSISNYLTYLLFNDFVVVKLRRFL